MTREEAKKQLVAYMYYAIDDMPEEVGKAFDVAISALSESPEPEADGTLVAHVKDGSTVSRVLVIGDNIFGGLYYPDSESDNKELTYAEVETWANEHNLVAWSEDMSEKALEALKKIRESDNKGEWIPVTERLPEEDKEVLIFTKDKEINKAYHTLKEWSDTQWEWFVFGTLGYSLTYSDNEVLAWQPLPEPYEI